MKYERRRTEQRPRKQEWEQGTGRARVEGLGDTL